MQSDRGWFGRKGQFGHLSKYGHAEWFRSFRFPFKPAEKGAPSKKTHAQTHTHNYTFGDLFGVVVKSSKGSPKEKPQISALFIPVFVGGCTSETELLRLTCARDTIIGEVSSRWCPWCRANRPSPLRLGLEARPPGRGGGPAPLGPRRREDYSEFTTEEFINVLDIHPSNL